MISHESLLVVLVNMIDLIPTPAIGSAQRGRPIIYPDKCAYAGFTIQTEKTLEAHVHQFTLKEATCYTDEWQSYNHIIREHKTVYHVEHELARDDDGDGIREAHTNTAECMWTDVRNYLRPFKGVHNMYLSGYVAIAEFRRNLKRISPAFIAVLVTLHKIYT